MMRTTFFLIVMTAVACGGKSAAPKHGGHEGGEHDDLPAPVAAFHDVLSPLWHQAPGAQRTTDTCAAIATFRERAMNLVTTVPPEPAAADAEGWRDATSALVSAVEELDQACAAPDRAGFDEKFAHVHDEFHQVMERSVPPRS
jgi:hypothetical protein